jgi:diguanylate cyclase (GGDEF)-like protein
MTATEGVEAAEKNSVLIVDDEKANIIALTMILSPEYTVYAAKNGEDALAIAKEHQPDVILLDILMPDMDGYEVLTALKKDENTCEIPVIFVTGLTDSEDEERGLTIGAADYISKPFRPAIIKLRVRNQIQMRNQFNIINNLSLTDPLTGIPNRRNFDNWMRAEWNNAKRSNTPLSILVADIDFFKDYNDKFGHLQGDVALQVVAKALMSSVRRSNDFVARWGGEEFVALLPAACLAGAMEVAENVRNNIKGSLIPCSEDGAQSITVSIGVNTVTPDKKSTISEFIEGADRALYEAKNTGRDKVCDYKSSGNVENHENIIQ